MKLVRENINFQRGLDPKEAMHIGKFAPRVFTDDKEKAYYLFSILNNIFDGEIPADIINKEDEDGTIPESYYNIINDFCKTYDIEIKRDHTTLRSDYHYWPWYLRQILIKAGYKYIRKKRDQQ